MRKTLLLCLAAFSLSSYAQTWKQLNSGVSVSLIGGFVKSPAVCYVCGGNGVILRTTDGGDTWVPQTSGTNATLYAIRFTDANNGYVVGDGGTALRTTNGGMTWLPMNFTGSSLRDVWFQNATTGYIVGSAASTSADIYKTTDSGNSWQTISPGSGIGAYSVFFTNATTGYVNEYSGVVYKTTNGGSSWTPNKITNAPLNGTMYFLNDQKGFVTGFNGSILITQDAGGSWNPANTGNTDNLTGLDFYDNLHGTAVGGDVGANQYRMLSTSDGGATWNNITLNPGTQRLCRIDYYDYSLGYAVGLGGTIYKWNSPVTKLDARFTSSEPGCLGQLENFYSVIADTSGVTHSWSFGSGATPSASTDKNPTGIVYSTMGAKLVTHIVSDGINSDTVTNIITINPVPTADFTSVSSACSNTAVDFTNTSSSATGITYNWDFGSGSTPSVSTSQHPKGIIYNSSGPKTITLSVTNQFGCVTSSTDSLYIHVLPQAIAGPDKVICQNMSVQLGSSPLSGHTYNWQPSGTLNSAVLANPVASPAVSTGYLLTVTSLSTGCKNSDSVYVSVNPVPIAIFTSNAPVCQGIGLIFTNMGTSGPGITYAWDFGKDANPKISVAQNPEGISYFSSGTKNVTLAVTNSYGCVTLATQAISIHSLPEAFAGLDTTICANTSVPLGKSPLAGLIYNWFPSSTLSNKNIANPVASPIAPVTNYNLTVTNPTNGCKNYDTVVVTMIGPLDDFAGADEEICRYDSFQVGKGIIKGQLYSWSPAKGLTDPTLPNPVASPDSTTTYTLTVTGSGCPAITDQVTVTVHQLPIADAGKNDTITKGTSMQLNASGGMQYSWSPSTSLNIPGIYNPIANPLSTTVYKVTVTDIFGCVNSDTMRLTVLMPHFWVPTAFTPDGNGISDVFYVRGEGIENFEFVIFNRWGEQLFISRDIDVGWDGKRQNGSEELPVGAYVYRILGTLSNGDVINSSGVVNLIR